MPTPISPNTDSTSGTDDVRLGYAQAALILAGDHYRLGQLALQGGLDPQEAETLQDDLVTVWQALGARTPTASRDSDIDDRAADDAETPRAGGRTARSKPRPKAKKIRTAGTRSAVKAATFPRLPDSVQAFPQEMPSQTTDWANLSAKLMPGLGRCDYDDE